MNTLTQQVIPTQAAVPTHREIEHTDVHQIPGLSEATRAVIKATAPILADKGVELVTCMYRRMFSENPELKAYFNNANQISGKQPRSLASAVYAVAAHIDDLDVLAPAVERIAHKHAALGVKPEHYPIVGKHLLKAMQEVLGAAVTPEILAAWAETYIFLSGIFIRAEQAIYVENAQQTGGWAGFRRFRVVNKIPECDSITSFYLQPVDGKPLASYQPGQYLTVKFDDVGPDGARRNYSLSGAPGQPYYRVTVKRELLPPGEASEQAVSHHMHDRIGLGDVIEVGPPCGDFVLKRQDQRPIVLIGAGVGITPLVSMLCHLADQGHRGEVYFIHGTRNRTSHALREDVHDIARTHENFHRHVCYSAPSLGCVKGVDYDTRGRIDRAVLERVLPGPDCEFYFLGPSGFMRSIRRALLDWGVPEAQLHFEFFGPAEDLD